METLQESKQKVEIEYPASWSYKLIATSEQAINETVFDVIGDTQHTLVHSNNSKNGKYISMNLNLTVKDENDKNNIFESLKKHDNIKMVL
ncbi:MAG: DUF493 domain-containing protein [Campylobacterota bacterium]|nr:DUF493 domain-containing protein [Campylobacterota bacterium]